MGYAPPEERPPLLSYAVAMGIFNALFAAALLVGLLFAPRLTRFVAAAFSALTIADFLQVAYKAAEEKGLES